jgi:hypothetical protein
MLFYRSFSWGYWVIVVFLLIPALCRTQTVTPKPGPSKNLVYVLDKIWPSDGTGSLSLKDPEALSIAPDGTLYIADSGNHRIVQWEPDGKVLRTLGSFGDKAVLYNPPEFDQPCGVYAESSGRIYVGDTLNHRVVVVGSSGMYEASWGSLGTANGFFNMPRTVAGDHFGNIWVLDSGNSRVQVFSPMGEFHFTWGSLGTTDYLLNNPLGLAINSIDQGIIADTGNFRFEVFDNKAAPVTQIGWFGDGPQEFKEPAGVAVDRTGLMALSNADRVDFYNDDDGEFEYIGRWKAGSHWAGLKTPPRFVGIACDMENRIYVTDVNHNWLVRLRPRKPFEELPVEGPSPTPQANSPYNGQNYPIR